MQLIEKPKKVWFIIILFLVLFANSYAIGADLKGKICFSTQNELLILNLEDRGAKRDISKITLPHKFDTVHNPAWFPNREKIIFEYTPWNTKEKKIKKYFSVAEIKKNDIYPFANDVIKMKESFLFPKWSPNGKYLSFLDRKRTELIKRSDGIITKSRYLNKLMLYDSDSKKLNAIDQIFAARSPLSWSSDSSKIAFTTSNEKVAIYYLHKNVKVFLEGSYPVFNPVTDEVYYVAPDTHLYKIGGNERKRIKIDDRDWSWFRPISISGDGINLFFIGGGSFIFREYSTINVFNIISHKTKRLSKKYSNIHGASLFEGK